MFYIPYALTNTLFTRYAIVDAKDEDAILFYKNRIMNEISIEDARKALAAKIWNGENPKQPATREETSAMIYRALQTLVKKP